MFNITKRIGTLAAAASLALISTQALAKDTTLVLSSWLPPKHPIVTGAIKPWAREVSKVTEGRVTVRILAKPLGPPPAHFDMAQRGIADITYGLHSFTTDDRFTRSRIGQFSFLADDAISGSKAFWNVYGGTLEGQKEHEGTKLLGLFMHGPGVLHNTVREVKTVADLEGMKIRVPGGYVSNLLSNLGATTLFMSTGEVYEKLTRGVIDGVTFAEDALAAFKLSPYVKHTMKVPGGLYNTTWFLVANEGRWAEISPKDQAAIEAISGEAFAELVGTAWNSADEKGAKAGEKDGVNIHMASDEVIAAIKESTLAAEATWAAAIAADGYDGKAALEAFRAATGVEF